MKTPTIDQVCAVLTKSADKKYPESALWLGIIIQSIQDLKTVKIKPSADPKKRLVIQQRIKKNLLYISSAISFHSSDYFETVCDNAGLHPEYARRTIKMLHG